MKTGTRVRKKDDWSKHPRIGTIVAPIDGNQSGHKVEWDSGTWSLVMPHQLVEVPS